MNELLVWNNFRLREKLETQFGDFLYAFYPVSPNILHKHSASVKAMKSTLEWSYALSCKPDSHLSGLATHVLFCFLDQIQVSSHIESSTICDNFRSFLVFHILKILKCTESAIL